jgi:hypothetical protein
MQTANLLSQPIRCVCGLLENSSCPCATKNWPGSALTAMASADSGVTAWRAHKRQRKTVLAWRKERSVGLNEGPEVS